MRYFLKQARLDKKLTYQEMASLIGVSRPQYSRIEAGTRGTTEENWLKIFKILNCEIPLNSLMGREVTAPTPNQNQRSEINI